MNLRKLYILGVMMMQVFASSCAKIDKFSSPHMLEGFTGVVKVTPGIDGITAKTYAAGLIFFNSNKDGTEVIMYGPSTENFSLYSILPEGGQYKDDDGMSFREYMNKFKGVPKLDKLDFSGFRGHVESDGNKITFNDFGDQSEGMRKFKWRVTGEGIIAGPDSHVVIVITTDVGTLQDLLPTSILDQLGAPDSNLSLREFEDRTKRVTLAQIEVLGESLTFGY